MQHFDMLRLYQTLPYSLRVLAASLHGYRLRMMRYSSETDLLVIKSIAHESWTPSQWNAWRQEHLAKMLINTSNRVPYYRRQWELRRRNGDHSSVEVLANWPVLSKDILRQQPRAFVADSVNLSSQIVEHTSGTTGKPLTLWMSKYAVRQWYALFEARWRGWYGLSRYDRWGILGGQMVTPFTQNKPPYWVWNAGLNQLYLSSYHLAPKNIEIYLGAIKRHRLIYLLGYASSLYSLAQLALEQNLNIPVLQAIISNAEPLYTHQREVISRAFGCPVYDTYGLSENVCAASECAEGNLHLWPEVGIYEILRDDADVPTNEGEVGRLVCTGLLNSTMPLIRYEVGDRAAISTSSCDCGRSMPILKQIDGRIDDTVLTKDGRRVGRLDPVFKADMPIRDAQIIQDALDHLCLKIVPAPGYSSRIGEDIIHRVRDRVGDVQIKIEIVDSMPRSGNGKFQAVVSKIGKDSSVDQQ